MTELENLVNAPFIPASLHDLCHGCISNGFHPGCKLGTLAVA